MSYSQTVTESHTFTITHARHISAKVATDLRRMNRFYGKPEIDSIANFDEEVAQLLKHGYLNNVSYGFQKNGDWIEPTITYTASELSSGIDSTPGAIKPHANIAGASFCSFLTYTSKWHNLTETEKRDVENGLPVQRTTGETPGISGYLEDDKTYSSGDRSLSRAVVRSYS